MAPAAPIMLPAHHDGTALCPLRKDAGTGRRLARFREHTVGPFDLQLKRTASLFGALAEAIVYQQLTGKAAATIFARLCALFPRPQDGATAEHLLRLSDARLRAAGLSRPKILSLRDLARKARDGAIPSLADVPPWTTRPSSNA